MRTIFSVVIPNLIVREEQMNYYRRCVDSLGEEAELIICDNGSKSVFKEVFLADVSRVGGALVDLQKPAGFARAVNRGVAASEGEYVLIFNNDAQIWGDWRQAAQEFFDEDAKNGILIPYLRNQGEEDYTAQMVGCAFIVRRAMWEELNGLSEEFEKGYYEDTDLFMRAIDTGWFIKAEPSVQVDHQGQTTFRSIMTDEEIHRLSGDNHKKYIAKHGERFPTFNR